MDDIRNVPMSERAYIVLRDSIIKGNLKPSERLVEDALAEAFQVSRTPLREALHRLQLDGYVVKLPKRGLMVAEVSAEQAKELYEVRAYLDGLAARLAAERLTDGEEDRLKGLRSEIYQKYNPMDYKKLRELDFQIHDFICAASKHSVCIEHLNRLYPRLLRYRNISAMPPGRMKKSGEEHLEIIDCILQRKGDQAEAAMKAHIIIASEIVGETIRKMSVPLS